MQRVLRQCPPIEAAILPGAKASKRTMRDLRATQSLVPKARTKNPVQFSSTLVRFSSTPVRFSLTRVQFSSTLVRFSSTPAWFSLTRVRFPSTPVQFSVRFSLTELAERKVDEEWLTTCRKEYQACGPEWLEQHAYRK